MVTASEVVLRRTWPQRFVVLMSLAVIGSALAAAWFVWTLYGGLADVPRIEIGREILRSETPPGEPVNFLLVGTDSARGLDPDDPILIDREEDPDGRSLADTIMLLRLDPRSGQAWVVSFPRDLIVEIPDAQVTRINAALFVGGPQKLVETVSANFDVEVNHYVQLDLLGFREVVEVLGGVPVWFPNPARDLGSGLQIPTAGCQVLDGTSALSYVRGRRYEELIDDEWIVTGGDDFRRIERQQDFLVLALERAIDRGARSPTTLASLLGAGADSVLLDNNLTLAELIDLGRAFSEFNPETLERLSLQLHTVIDASGAYQGEAISEEVNEPLLDVFRGAVDSVRPRDVTIVVTGFDESAVADVVSVFADDVGFGIGGFQPHDERLPETVVVHGPGERTAAVLVARHIDPVPHVVEDARVDGVTLVLGDDYRGVLWLFPTPRDETEAAIAEAGRPEVSPDLGGELFDPTTTTSDPDVTTSVVTTTTVAPGSDGTSVPPTTIGTRGRPPEGESCG